MYVIACAFRWGVALVEEFFLLGIAHPIVGPLLCIGRRRSDEAVIAKEADMWP